MPLIKFAGENQNLEMCYELHGTGKTKIIFIMGLLTDGNAWVCQSSFFAQQPEYQCVTYDNRGCGRSSSPLTLHYSTTQMAKDALALLDHLQWPQCHVVGISMGGMIALELAVLAPKRILSLTLLATHAGGLPGRAPLTGVLLTLESIMLSDKNRALENVLSMLYGSKTLANSEKRQILYDYHSKRFDIRVPPTLIGVLGHLFAVLRHYVSYADLLRIRYSPFDCLIIVGTEDRLVREANSYIIRKVLGARLIQIQDAGHGLPGECAEEINEELLKMYESIRLNPPGKTSREIPREYQTEIKALDQCCKHRTHCFIHDIVGFIKGCFLGLIFYIFLGKFSIFGMHFTFQTMILFGCLNGIRRSIQCIHHAYYARKYVREHELLLDRAAHHGGVGIILPEQSKNGIPHGCGFDFPIYSVIFTLAVFLLIYSSMISPVKSLQ